MNDVVISVENLWKQYRFGSAHHATLRSEFQSWWARMRKKDDPNLPLERRPATQFEPSDDRFWALQNLTFTVKRGETVGILGKNGAGKSTLLKIMSRVTTPTRGKVKVKGYLAGILEVGTGFHWELTGRENIFLNGAILGMTRAETEKKFEQIVDFSELRQFIDMPLKRYSSGMYMRLAFAVAAHREPEILVVDEALAVGDLDFQKKCLARMNELAGEGRTVLCVSHDMNAIEKLTNRCLVIHKGQIVFDGPTTDGIRFYTQS